MKKNILIIFIIGFCFKAFSQTTINANSSVFGKWTKANSPYYIKGNISVPRDSTLLIEAGVRVRFDGKYRLAVYGNIKAQGKMGDTIRFFPQDTNNRWLGIRYWGRSQQKDSALFSYCIFEYAGPKLTNFENALRISRANSRISNCVFRKNQAKLSSSCLAIDSCDNNLVENCLFKDNWNINTDPSLTTSSSPGVFGMTTGKILNCVFENNISRNRFNTTDSWAYHATGSGGILYFSDNSIKNPIIEVENCIFRKNGVAFGGAAISIFFVNNGRIRINNCTFEDNNNGRYGTVHYSNNNNSKRNYKIVIENCIFRRNRTANFTTSGEAACISTFEFNSNDSLVIRNNLFEKNVAFNSSVYIQARSNVFIMNNVFRNNYTNPIKSFGKYNCYSISNMFYNNYLGNNSSDKDNNTSFYSINDLYAFNGNKNIDTIWLEKQYITNIANGLYKEFFPSNIIFLTTNGVFRNCIFWNNKDYYGQHRHIESVDCNIREISNCIFSGDTNTSITWGSLQSGQTPPSNFINSKRNWIVKDPIFENPPSDYGPTVNTDNVSFRLKNDCQGISPAFNAGWNAALANWNNLLDKDGNSRLACDTVDIGPYEIQGRKNAITVRSQTKDSSICTKETLLLSAQASCAPNTSWQWQINQNNTWQDYSQAMPLSYQANQNAQFRAIVTSTDCQVKDTSNVINIFAKPLPMPNLGNDTIILHNQNITLNPGNFTTYLWNTGASTPTLNINGRTEPLGIKTISVKVTNQEGCSASDTIKITINFNTANSLVQLMQVNIYPNPTLGQLNIDNPQQKDIIYQLMGTDGKVWLSGNNNQNIQLDLSNFPKQVYILSLTAEGQTQHLKIVRE
jgi:hypothetical protein